MPTYSYKCENCGEFKVRQKMSDNKLTECPKCNGKIIKLVSNISGVIFKGKGFYETDYKRRK